MFKEQVQRFLSGSFVVTFIILNLLNDEILTEARTSSNLKVQLPHGGILVGRHLSTHKGRHMRAFMGIPYAQPPIGELRFKPPVPYGSWKGEKLVIKDSFKCIQRDPFRRDQEVEGSEDCLYINIYTPEKTNISEPLPVMVWFHGGGWECGSGISSFYGPDFLLDYDIILVSANFRLGALGFLSTETVHCPGNYGLKDQQEILKWIQVNIQAFGGNPNSVTIFGESAGGASVTYHMLSSKSQGLFHKGIAQSGTYFNPWAQPAHKGVAAKRANKTALLLGCYHKNSNDWPEIINCLKQQSAYNLTAIVYDLFEWDTDPMIPFPPVIEPDHAEAFLTVHPRNQLQPHGLALPLMIGATSEEGLLKTAALLNLPEILYEFKTKFEQILPIILYYDHLPEKDQHDITEKLKYFYLKDGHNYDKHNYQNITDLISDGWFLAGIDEYIRLRMSNLLTQAHNNAGPTYVYMFEHKGSASFSELFHGGREDYYGACHAEELQYLFPIARELFVSAAPTNSDLKLRDLMLQLWTNFAWNSNPTPDNFQADDKWLPSKVYPVYYAKIGNKDSDNSDALLFDYNTNMYKERLDFWHQLKPHVRSQEFHHDEL
ncbi:venom carboxylesterase-6 [Glossina fuscipes]|uniref:Carboxylic ester hydrolase n=1 Tax=Glossina fuscipes TaxID=7396 RepID=A0A8U0WKR9_9MUSC|nr:venom carboxylesterase-6 [Glossina fuscipes]